MNGKELMALLLHIDKIEDDIPWVIWGAGKRGILALNYLKNYGLKVAGFIDSDVNKLGRIIEDTECFSKDLLKGKLLYILISPINSDDLYHNLQKEYKYVLPTGIIEIMSQFSTSAGYDYIYPIGHYYSPYPDKRYIEEKSKIIFNNNKEIKDIDLNEYGQKRILEQLIELYSSIPKWKCLEDNEVSEYRYRYHNTSFSSTDAIDLNCMLRILQPNNIIEVGSGWSSAVTLDTNEFFMDNKMKISFIEPYADLLRSLCKRTDQIRLLEEGLQEVPLEFFDQLEEGDLLFIDSTHVSKAGSDVNYLFFEIFPRLKKGVYIHIHDVFSNFEYPKEWILKGMVWNELYLLRAFLQNNHSYSIVYFQNMMHKTHGDLMRSKWPIADKINGGSFWMKKI